VKSRAGGVGNASASAVRASYYQWLSQGASKEERAGRIWTRARPRWVGFDWASSDTGTSTDVVCSPWSRTETSY
jgi:hypothetical protein